MALPMLVGGSECGPSNPLQGLSKRFDQDRGLQQDYFGAGRAGSSRETFRSPNPTTAGGSSDHDAQRFFAQNVHRGGGHMAAEVPVFDVSAMRAALPPTQMLHQQQPHTVGAGAGSSGAAAWASDFMMQQPILSPSNTALAGPNATFAGGMQQQQDAHHQPIHAHMQPAVQTLPWNPAMTQFRMNTMPAFAPQMHAQTPAASSKRISWDREFSAQELNLAPPAAMEEMQQTLQQEQEATSRKEFEGDELARTAGLLLEHIKHEQNPKFAKSQFLGLMKQLRDGEVIVDGNKVVESDGTRTFTSTHVDVKGKGRAIDPMGGISGPGPQWASDFATQGLAQSSTQQGQQQKQSGETTTEDPLDAYFRQENAEYTKYWSEAGRQRERERALEQAAQGYRTTEEATWDTLQGDWDRFEATASGIKPVSQYAFQTNNPYMLGESSRTRNHMLHLGERQAMLENVLELEAAVQRDPLNAAAWYELGVKQQENERESKALQALQRAVELDPSLLSAWLALAVSYTNDNDRQGTYASVSQWVARNDKYRHAAEAFRAESPLSENALMTEKFGNLIQCLIAMARSDVTGEVDADIQIALAVLLNSHEEYEKAQDCFRTALAVRPDDWLLYNRVGATMANSGRAEEAIQYYYKALELNPGYIRARFNLGISCMNLKRYDEAAQHILDALLLQDSDNTATANLSSLADKQDVISTALWTSLQTTCFHLQRPDLAALCDLKDLEGFRQKFYS
ncbi:hypothetical protein D9611_003865 [Ephemerocybe angulata]|uniref:TPR-like protein n=1 Tax=Ephemerocybe angulata TaxID=980116 RepID=A0A8H5EYS8_9AGAR|nr:hypothetical protein D9611_003865 [Tulosesus angulatus]